jgi:AcrR family transcriptional regulator
VTDRPTRKAKTRATRARISEAALELFVTQGFAETTIDQIAEAARVGRRTIFRHFATKEAILFDQLVVRREVTLARLRERPPDEPPLVSLHAVLRELCEQGYDRRLLGQIRAVLAAQPRGSGGGSSSEVSGESLRFQLQLAATLHARLGDRTSHLETHALAHMASSWFLTSVQIYLLEGRRSLVKVFDEVVALCTQATVESRLGPP